MASTRPGEGTKLMIKISSVFTEIGLVEEIDGPEVTLASIKKTALSSGRQRFRPSRTPDPGKMTFKVQFDPDDSADVQQLLYSKIATPPTANDDFKLIFVDDQVVPANATFSGFLTKFKMSGMKNEENLMAECEIQLDTLPVFTEGAAS